jgi:UDP-2-acetamido-3-amino-2,3-dideoxy-glucuronate N-acetyltransferase
MLDQNALHPDPDAPLIHASAVVDPGACIGQRTRIWHFCHIMFESIIGADCSLGQNCFVATGVRIGDRVRIQNNVSIYAGVEIDDDVFLGPSMVFTNVVNPRAGVSRKHEYRKTRVHRGVTVGANATVLPGVTLNEYCFIGAAALVRVDVPAHALMVGVPARQIGWMSRSGERLCFGSDGFAVCSATGERYREARFGLELVPEGA